MSDKRTIILDSSISKALAHRYIDEAPEGYVAIIQRKTRSLEQSAKFHSICGDVSKQRMYMERKLPLQSWKVLFVSGHAIATKLGADVVPGLEGEFVNLRESTANMTVSRMSSVIEYCLAWCYGNGVILRNDC